MAVAETTRRFLPSNRPPATAFAWTGRRVFVLFNRKLLNGAGRSRASTGIGSSSFSAGISSNFVSAESILSRARRERTSSRFLLLKRTLARWSFAARPRCLKSASRFSSSVAHLSQISPPLNLTAPLSRGVNFLFSERQSWQMETFLKES